jgi:hypothetical protein
VSKPQLGLRLIICGPTFLTWVPKHRSTHVINLCVVVAVSQCSIAFCDRHDVALKRENPPSRDRREPNSEVSRLGTQGVLNEALSWAMGGDSIAPTVRCTRTKVPRCP